MGWEVSSNLMMGPLPGCEEEAVIVIFMKTHPCFPQCFPHPQITGQPQICLFVDTKLKSNSGRKHPRGMTWVYIPSDDVYP